jgi:hypothetical protein
MSWEVKTAGAKGRQAYHLRADCHEILYVLHLESFVFVSFVLFCCYGRMLLLWHPCCPWDFRDHVTTLAAAKTVAGALSMEVATFQSAALSIRNMQ